MERLSKIHSSTIKKQVKPTLSTSNLFTLIYWDYYDWLQQQNLISEWLFPSIQHPERHITEKQFYKVMAKVGDLLGINYLGTHTMRKTGAYRVYMQSNYNIGLVMQLLNHSSEAMTLTYLGLDQASRETILDQINFG
ncbi:tyrosine-type recombinase/integrase [Leuconostoc mesenteroides]|nr:tyrosine-type recombinase/integrase [Leuconostoc mesenteroides]MCU4665884.1 tyrosine-type recombinase/integrase [Leuconostoc mesenteroides]